MLDQKIADFTVGFNPGFLNSPIMWGRETIISLSNGEKHRAKFLIVDMDNIKASHNEHTFASTDGYPLNASGENINDRNYEKDLNAQARVIDAAQNLDPNIIISTSRTDSGTPIITKDGIVISGNNRTMSLKLAEQLHPDRYKKYLDLLREEIDSFKIELMGDDFSYLSHPHSRSMNEIEDEVLKLISTKWETSIKTVLAGWNKGYKTIYVYPDNDFKKKYNCNHTSFNAIDETELSARAELVNKIAFCIYEHERNKSQKVVTVAKPILVRMDYDFPEYTTAELAKYNKNRKKSERPVDVAIKIGKILNEKPACKESISNIVGNYETFSDFYSSIVDQKAMRNTLLGCEIISDNDLAQYFDNRGFTEAGKDLVENILAGIILSTKALLSGNFPGVRTIRNAIITSLPVLIKNNSLGPASIIKDVDEAFLLQSAIVASGNDFEYYMRQRTLFGENHDEKTVVINRLLNSGRNRFKAAIEAYNNAIDDNTKPSFFNDNLSAETIFEKTITARIPETDQKTIYAAFHQAQGREFMIELNRAIRENKPALYNTIENNRGQEKAVLEPLLSNAFWNIVNKNLEKWLPVVADIENNTGFNNFYDQLSDELVDEYNSMAAFEPVEKRVGGRIEQAEPAKEVLSQPAKQDGTIATMDQLGTGANIYFKTEKHRVNDDLQSGKVWLNIGGKDHGIPIANIQFDNAADAVKIAERINKDYPTGVPDAVLVNKYVEGLRKELLGEQEAVVVRTAPPNIKDAINGLKILHRMAKKEQKAAIRSAILGLKILQAA